MTKQRNILFWAILSFLSVTSCANLARVPINEPAISENCNLSVLINEVNSAFPGETVFLALNKTGFGWEYRWSTTAGILSEPASSSTAFTTPEDARNVTVSVEVINAQDCSDTDRIEINVMHPPTLAAAQTAGEETAAEPTLTVTIPPTATATSTVAPTSTPEPTQLSESATTVAPSPTKPPVPTSTPPPPIVTPVITDHEILPGAALILFWNWDNELGPDQHFAVRFWLKSDPRPEARNSITWTKERSYQFSIDPFPPGEYLMNVAIMTGPSDGEHHEVARSPDVQVYVPPVVTPLPPP